MGKNTRKPAAPRKPKNTPLGQSSPTFIKLVKSKFIHKTPSRPPISFNSQKVNELLNEELLTCSICLQLLLSPVLAQCGHCFCMSCAQDLAKHGFACGICHSHEPSYDLPRSSVVERLIEDYVMNIQEEEQFDYSLRKNNLEKRQENRKLGDVEEGNELDFWCKEENLWKNGRITQISKNRTLIITPKRETTKVAIPSTSRRLAQLHFFTKEEIPEVVPEVRIQPNQIIPRENLDGIPIRIDERQNIFGMPSFYVGVFWRGVEDVDRNRVPNGFNPFTF